MRPFRSFVSYFLRKLIYLRNVVMQKTMRIPLRVVFYREDDQWVAHCLEFDTVGHGNTQSEALKMLSQASAIQVEESFRSGNARNLFSPADSEYFAKFAAGKDIAVGELELMPQIQIERTESREYCGAPELVLA